MEPQAVEQLLDAAFGRDRFSRTAYRIREGAEAVAELSFALVEAGLLVGTIQCWPVAHHAAEDGAVTPLVMVGPVAVRPDVQRGGHGRALMAHMLERAEGAADGALMMIGDPEYYGRFFGFDAAATGVWELPGPFERRRLLARAVNGHAVPAAAGMIGPRGGE
ncbi:GNAT family N-acetyltransferase [Sphingopyxis sp. MWB1]|uniref:GNAT family N-acetyltransferase n=1 Tax=Sphingopyxis sp. MWB1 TaxID=1537715 RepID=UPI003FA74127